MVLGDVIHSIEFLFLARPLEADSSARRAQRRAGFFIAVPSAMKTSPACGILVNENIDAERAEKESIFFQIESQN